MQSPIEHWLKLAADKAPLPPRRPLGSLDKSALGPYRFIAAEPLTPETVEALGTEMYICWTLEDPRRPPDSPLRLASLFVTYYTGGPELAVHRPEVCLAALGYAVTRERRDVSRSIDTIARDVPFRVLTFTKTGLLGRSELAVAYTFFCNGRFTANHRDIRFWGTSPRVRHAFFSKVEVSFKGASPGVRAATDDETLDGAVELLRHVLPRLMNDIWPDFEAAERGR